MEKFERKESDSIEISPERKKLDELEKTGLYVFHGTGEEIKVLEPRQAADIRRGPEGNPSVFASPLVDYAIFMAIMHGKNFNPGPPSRIGTSVLSSEDGSLSVSNRATRSALNKLRDDASGIVYVFEKGLFYPREGHPGEYRSNWSVSPFLKIMVHRRDLPKNIEIIPE